jgi:hypothetical protein
MVIPWDDENHVGSFGRIRSLAFEALNGSEKVDICLAMTERHDSEIEIRNDNDHEVKLFAILDV